MRDDTPHRLVMTKDIGTEWKRNTSRWARTWLRNMNSKRRVYRPDLKSDDILRREIEDKASNESDLNKMLKDLHLIDAAMATDRSIVSLDEKARKPFAAVSDKVGELRNIVWVNPAEEDERPVEWLLEGAPAEEERFLHRYLTQKR
ncbi:MAG: hypothetical protein U9N48_07055 [Euryarchaeota archaeon]|nr:hypothetical protein [Euryarchaeota archaeon]